MDYALFMIYGKLFSPLISTGRVSAAVLSIAIAIMFGRSIVYDATVANLRNFLLLQNAYSENSTKNLDRCGSPIWARRSMWCIVSNANV